MIPTGGEFHGLCFREQNELRQNAQRASEDEQLIIIRLR